MVACLEMYSDRYVTVGVGTGRRHWRPFQAVVECLTNELGQVGKFSGLRAIIFPVLRMAQRHQSSHILKAG
jgi:hypothetical protein